MNSTLTRLISVAVSATALVAMVGAPVAQAATYSNCYPNGSDQCSDPMTIEQIQAENWSQYWPGWDFAFDTPELVYGWTGGPPPGGMDWQMQSLESLPARFDTGSRQCIHFSAPVRLFQVIVGWQGNGGYPIGDFYYSDGTDAGWSNDLRNYSPGKSVSMFCIGSGGWGWHWGQVTSLQFSKFWEPMPVTATPGGSGPVTMTPTSTPIGTATPTGTPTPIAGPTHISNPIAESGNTGWECSPGQAFPKCSDWLDLQLVNSVWSRANLPAEVPAWDGVRMWTDPVQNITQYGYVPDGFEWRADSLMDGEGYYDTSATQCLYFPEPVPLWGIKIAYTEGPSGRGEFQYSAWDTSNRVEARSHTPILTYDKDHLVRSLCIYFSPLGPEWSHVHVSRVQVRRWLYESEYTNVAVGTPTALPTRPVLGSGIYDWSTPTPMPAMPADVQQCFPFAALIGDVWECPEHTMEITRVAPGSGGMIDIYGDAMMVVPHAIQFQSVTLDGTAQVSQGVTDPWLATDPTGLGAGWHLTLAATDFSDGQGHAIPVNGFRATLADSGIVRLYGSAAPTTTMNLATVLSTTPQMLLHAAADTGMGQYALQPTFTLDVPSNTYVGTYTSVVTVQIISGP